MHRDDRTPSVAQLLEEFGVARVQKLKTVVAAASAPPPPTYTAADPPPALVRPVVAERAVPAEPERRSSVGALLLLLAVIGAGVAAWFYQEPIRQFATDLMAEVDAQMNRASGERRSRSRACAGAGAARDGPGRHRRCARHGARARREAAGCDRIEPAARGDGIADD